MIKTTIDSVWEFVCLSARLKSIFAVFSVFVLSLFTTLAHAGNSTFTLQSIPNNYTMILGNGAGDTITVSGAPTDPACFNVDFMGRVKLFAGTSDEGIPTPICDQSIIMTFTTSGFDLGNVEFADIDDMDGTTPRDSFSANVPGTWSSLTGLGVYTFLSPPSFADQAVRLSSAGGIGTFLARSTGNNPLDDKATFVLDTPVTSFSIIFDDAEGLRSAEAFFTLTPLPVFIDDDPIVAVAESLPSINGLAGGVTTTVLASDTLNGVTVNPPAVTITVGVSSPALTLNPATGLITVAPSTAAGTYTVAYTICENLSLTNCATVTETVTVTAAPIVAVAETFPNVDGIAGGVTTTVLASDTLNGVAINPLNVTISVGASASQLTLNATTGLITVAPGTGAGNFTAVYTICENLNLTNCSTATETVIITTMPIVAVAETIPSINGLVGGATVSILTSDTLNGSPLVPADATLTVNTIDTELSFNPVTRIITVAPNTSAGSYTLNYTVCETANLANCSTVTETVTVTAAPIIAVAESFPGVNSVIGGVTTTVLGSDTLNGVAVISSAITITVGASSPELTLNPMTGLITVAANTSVGSYTVVYTICENLNPSNCASVTETVSVFIGPEPIVAVAESFPSINGLDGGVTTTVLVSDTLSGAPVTLLDVTLIVGVSSPELTLDLATGLITLAPNTAAGVYTVGYKICQNSNLTNCSTVTETVTVTAAPILAVAESFPSVDGIAGGVTTTVLGSDTLNGVAVTPSAVTITVGVSSPQLTLNPATGLITVSPSTAAGTYTVAYTICENLNPTNCSTGTETVVVGTMPIIAVAETIPPISGLVGGTTPSILTSDTLNGSPLNPTDATLTVNTISLELSFDAMTNIVTVAPNTPAGTYTLNYTVCETANLANCSTGTETVTVIAAPILAVAETFPSVDGIVGGVTTTVFASDTLNGVAVTPSDVTLTIGASTSELTLNATTGLITVAASTAAGSYTVAYTICENLNATNCSTVMETVTVATMLVVAVAETIPPISGLVGGTTPSILTSDTLNGSPLNPADATLTVNTIDTELSFDAMTNIITVAPNTPTGTYTLNYTVCETANVANCSSATETVTVTAAPIVAVAENFPSINGLDGGVTTTVLASDTLNGVAVNPSDVTLTVGTISPELTLDPATGFITLIPDTSGGTYTIAYTICEIINPTNCFTVTETVTVIAAPIVAVAESFPSVDGIAGGATTTVLGSDTLNGVAVIPSAVTITVGASSPELTLNPMTGLITVAPSTAAGAYTVAYTICENLNPINCSTGTEMVTVSAMPIVAVAETIPPINGLVGGTTPSILTSDTLNGSPLVPTDATLTVNTISPELSFDAMTNIITVAPNTSAGSYTLNYTVCETANLTNCSTGTETVSVTAAPIIAVAENFPNVDGIAGGVTTTVFASDTLNGVAVNPSAVTITVGASSPQLTLNPTTGLITVATNTSVGNYTVVYTICENLNATNCSTVTETVTVTATPIVALAETIPPISGLVGGTTPSILTSDTLNGSPLVPADVTVTVNTISPELSFDPMTKTITVAPNTPAGSYTLNYTVCETANLTNCSTGTETVTVEAPPIVAVAENFPPLNSGHGGMTSSILASDTLNGMPVDPALVTVSIGTLPPELVFDPVTHKITIAPNTLEGIYELVYTICETLNPTNCSTGTEKIIVDAPEGAVSGVVYLDVNGDDHQQPNEPIYPNWIVQLVNGSGETVASAVTDASGAYEVTGVPVGMYNLVFKNPDNDIVYRVIEDVDLDGTAVVVNQNLPIDPSGVVYNAVTRAPIQGVVMTMSGASGMPLPAVCFVDPSQQNQTTDNFGRYRFDIIPGVDAACPTIQTLYSISYVAPATYNNSLSTLISVEPNALSAPAGTGPFEVSPLATAPQLGDATTYYLSFLLGSGSRDIVNNHIPLDPASLVRSPLLVVKTTPRRDVSFGDLVPYTITLTNTEDQPRIDLDIVDLTPTGFKLVDGSVRFNGVPVSLNKNGRELVLQDQSFAPNETKTLEMILVVGAGVGHGVFTNLAYVRDPAGLEVSNRGEARVRVSPDPLFDCSEIIGKVFDDSNGNGYQDQNELGLPGVRLATAKGLLVTTDQHGRYHIACAAVPNRNIGSNFILKIDENTLPTGYSITTENPQVIRLTRGKMSKANFGAIAQRTVSLDLTDAAFIGGGVVLRLEWAHQLGGLIHQLKAQQSVLRLNYYSQHSTVDLANQRLGALSMHIQNMWQGSGCCYALNIEQKITRPDVAQILPQQSGWRR